MRPQPPFTKNLLRLLPFILLAGFLASASPEVSRASRIPAEECLVQVATADCTVGAGGFELPPDETTSAAIAAGEDEGVTLSVEALADDEALLPAWILPDAIAERGITRRGLTFWQPRAFPIDEILPETVLNGYNSVLEFDAQQPPASALGPSVTVDSWRSVGPSPMASCQIGAQFHNTQCTGRVTALAVDPSDANRWLLGFANGGIWETTDAGATWAPINDSASTLTVGAIAFAPSNPDIIYVGTGEPNLSCDSYAGLGVFKSVNGGLSWTLLGSTEFSGTSISSVEVNPADPDIVVVSSTVGLAGSGCALPTTVPATGFFRTTNGGVTWTPGLASASPRVRASDLRAQPGTFANMYGGQDGVGVVRSSNSGTSWTSVPGPWDTLSVGVVKVAFAPSAPNTVYVTIENGSTGNLLGLWRSDDAFAATPTWTQIDAAGSAPGAGVNAGSYGFCGWNAPFGSPGSQCWYDMVIIVDPTDEDVIYAGGITVYKFDGDTSTWTEVSGYNTSSADGIHADIHAFAWAESSRLLVGSDGGIWSLTDNGATRTNHNNAPLSGQQFYDGVLHPTDPAQMLGGAQDNGTNRRTTSDFWTLSFGGDGASSLYSLTSPDTKWISSSQFMNIVRTTNGGTSYSSARTGIGGSSPFIGKVEQCPNNENVMLAGTSSVYRTTNMFTAATGSAVSWAATPSGSFASLWRALGFAKSDANCNTWAAGTGGGTLRITMDGAATYRDLDSLGQVPIRYITDLAFDPADANVLYVTLSGFDEGTPGAPGHIFKSSNATNTAGPVTWTNISPPASNYPFNSIVVDPANSQVIYAGSDFGVWKSVDGGATWTHFTSEDGLPNVAIYDLEANQATEMVVAFTHGRGAYELVQERNTVGIAKDAATPTYNGDGSFTLVYDVKVQNFGNVALSAVQATDNLAATFAGATSFNAVSITSADFAVDAAFTGIAPNTNLLAGTDTLAVGASGVIQVTLTVTPGALSGPYSNTASAAASGPTGIPVSDISNSGTNPDTDADNDPTNNNEPTLVTFPSLVAITFTTSPIGRSFSVNGTTFTTSQTQLLPVGSPVTVATTTPQAGGAGTRFVFASWSDAGAISHVFSVPGAATTLTANFTTEYQLTTAVNGGGSVTPASGGFFPAGSSVGVLAVPGLTSIWSNWTGPVAAPLSAATTVAMLGPTSIVANFIGTADLSVTKTNGVSTVNPGVPTTYTLTLRNDGPSGADNTTLSDPAVVGLAKMAVGACTTAGGAVCPSAGAGPGQLGIINLEGGTVVVPSLPNGGSISFTVTALVTASSGNVTNTFRATTPPGTPDLTPAVASDTDRVVDTLPPVVVLTGPVDGGNYILGNVPTPACTTTEGPPASGVAVPASLTLTGANSNGAGVITATCANGRDNAGNIAPPVRVTYTVTCTPVATYAGTVRVKLNQLVTYRPNVTATVALDVSTCSVLAVSMTSAANVTGALRLDSAVNWKPPTQPAVGQWRFAMKTPNATTGGIFLNGAYRAMDSSSLLVVKFVNNRLQFYFKLTGLASNGVGITRVGFEAEVTDLALVP